MHTGSLSSTTSVIVALDALKEILTALGVVDVLDADVEALPDDAVADLLVDLDTDSAGGDVPDLTGAAVVELVGHALVDGTIALNVNVVANTEHRQIGAHVGETATPERLLEEVSGLGAKTVRVRHFLFGR